MIFVTVGNATQEFNRLLKTVDDLAGDGFFEGDKVIIQIGKNSNFQSFHCEQEDFIPPERYNYLIHKADLVICHGGAGSLYHIFKAGKVPVVMPRRKQYGEHIDDQFELVKALAAEGRIIPAYEPEDLPNAIVEAKRRNKLQHIPSPPSRMLELVAQAIEELLNQKR